ncbi:hypothetical protein QJS10_CPB21g00160 [Acorus calamus]|uniref:Uncharacterized protein n=1 Tax=Acorus calamus TaxID=4465 RepID=A0AAV9C3K4_ACOCL|nr:hypothetical protein QJS10_CPB21g00160 [Acorus calamus]
MGSNPGGVYLVSHQIGPKNKNPKVFFVTKFSNVNSRFPSGATDQLEEGAMNLRRGLHSNGLQMGTTPHANLLIRELSAIFLAA